MNTMILLNTLSSPEGLSTGIYLLIILLAIICLIFFHYYWKICQAVVFRLLSLERRSHFFNIIGMSLRKIPPRVIVSARINSYKAGLKGITVADLETHYLAGGHILDVVRAMIASDKANIELDWRQGDSD